MLPHKLPSLKNKIEAEEAERKAFEEQNKKIDMIEETKIEEAEEESAHGEEEMANQETEEEKVESKSEQEPEQ